MYGYFKVWQIVAFPEGCTVGLYFTIVLHNFTQFLVHVYLCIYTNTHILSV